MQQLFPKETQLQCKALGIFDTCHLVISPEMALEQYNLQQYKVCPFCSASEAPHKMPTSGRRAHKDGNWRRKGSRVSWGRRGGILGIHSQQDRPTGVPLAVGPRAPQRSGKGICDTWCHTQYSPKEERRRLARLLGTLGRKFFTNFTFWCSLYCLCPYCFSLLYFLKKPF